MNRKKFRRSPLRVVPLILMMAFGVVASGGGPGKKTYRFEPIDHPNAGELGTSVFGINPAGVMSGNYSDNEGVIHGFVLRKGLFTDVTVPGSIYTDLAHISSQGTAVGLFIDDQGFFHGFAFSADGTISYLPDAASGADTVPIGINNRGDVTGQYTFDGFETSHGFLYMDGKTILFDAPGAIRTVPWAVTNTGVVGGWFLDTDGAPHGFLRDRKGNFTQIDVPAATATFVQSLNDRGDIVGTYGDETTYHGFLLRKGEITTLDFPGSFDSDVFDINNAGVIVGTYDGFSRGYVAYPSN